MMNNLKTLEEHNSERWSSHISMTDNSARLNGIACPNCNEEMYDTFPHITLTSYPAQKTIHCENCKYSGYRIA
jgi:hypothetical protein